MPGLSEQAIALFRQGVAALEAEDFPSAERIFGALAASHPQSHEVWNALSVAAVRAGHADVAAERARRALELDRRNPLYMNSLGVACGELQDYAAAEAQFHRALKLKPNYAQARYNLGKVLHKQRRSREALQTMERAYAMDPECHGLPANLAELYLLHGEPERARRVLAAMRSLSQPLAPLYAECVAELEGFESAIAWLRAQMREHPDWHGLGFPLSARLLACGHWREGWQHYVARPGMERLRAGYHAGPLPERLDGRTLHLRNEQGLGDILFFLRFASMLESRGARVVASCPAPLVPLVQGAVDEMSDVRADLRIWMGDLPAALETSATPRALPLRADPARRERLAAKLATLGPRPYVALTWRAGTDMVRMQEFRQDYMRLSKEVPPPLLGAALRGFRGTLLAVQRLPFPGEVAAVSAAAGAPVHDFCGANADLAEMLALLDCLDDYIAVSNTNVHLHAGLGRTGRVLVPQPPEWRWMHEGDSSPWFPGFALYRQPVSRDWSAPLARLRGDLGL